MLHEWVTADFWKDPQPFIGNHRFLLEPQRAQHLLNKYSHILNSQNVEKKFYFLTSGTSRQQPKWVVLSRSAILTSAEAVNRHLQVTSQDHWLLALPSFHIGGFSLFARAYASGLSVTCLPEEKWQPFLFVQACRESKATLTALVPAQVYDLVQTRQSAPPTLRAVLVGGAALSDSCYQSARQLGWPLLPTYGMTETASQVATASLESWRQEVFPPLVILPHWSCVWQKEEGPSLERRLGLRGPSLCEATIEEGFGIKETPSPFWIEGDRLLLTKDELAIQRVRRVHSEFVKIGGEKIFLPELISRWKKACEGLLPVEKTWLKALNDPRLGTQLGLLYERSVSQEALRIALNRYTQESVGFEKKIRLLPYSSKRWQSLWRKEER